MKYLVLSGILALFVLTEVFASVTLLEGNIGYRHEHPISGQTLLVYYDQDLFCGQILGHKHNPLFDYHDYYKGGRFDTQIDNYYFPHPSLAGISWDSQSDQGPQSRNSIGTCINQKFELYQPGNEFYIGVTLSLANLRPSPMIKVKINNDMYRNNHSFKKGWHHLYTGIICYALGKKTKNNWAKTIGGVILADDLIQHAFRVQSPLHLLNNELWRHSWYNQPTKFMDKIMGKK